MGKLKALKFKNQRLFGKLFYCEIIDINASCVGIRGVDFNSFKLCGIPVCLFDERMTTMTAARFLNETNTRGQKRKDVIDALSAQIILQNFIDKLKNMKERG